jgi:hypothetical protein
MSAEAERINPIRERRMRMRMRREEMEEREEMIS